MGSEFVKCQIETDAGAILNKPLWVPALTNEPVDNRFASIREGVSARVYDLNERSSLFRNAGALENEAGRHWSVDPYPVPPSPAELVPVLPVSVALGLLDASDSLLGIALFQLRCLLTARRYAQRDTD
jgi:hypothetical protein